MKLPLNRVSVPSPIATKTPASASTPTASMSTSSPRSGREKAPTMSSAMAPTARLSSGSIATRLSCSVTGVRPLRREREPRLFGGGKACFKVGHQRLDRGGRDVEDRVGMEPEPNRNDDERRDHRDLPPGEILDVLQRGIGDGTENDAAVEP